MEEMILAMSTSMLASLRPKGTKVMQQFAKHTLSAAPKQKELLMPSAKRGRPKT